MIEQIEPLRAYDAQVYDAMEGAFYGDVHMEPPNGPNLPNLAAYYQQSPVFQEYFSALPPPVRRQIVQAEVRFATLGELKQCAEHLLHP